MLQTGMELVFVTSLPCQLKYNAISCPYLSKETITWILEQIFSMVTIAACCAIARRPNIQKVRCYSIERRAVPRYSPVVENVYVLIL